jgi:hypothetical protein
LRPILENLIVPHRFYVFSDPGRPESKALLVISLRLYNCINCTRL